MATGALDANGIWQYGEDDSNTTFSALLNRLGTSIGSNMKGRILQVVQNTASAQVLNTSNTFVDTGLSITITPKSASSKLIIFVNQSGVAKYGTGGSVWIKAQKNGTDFYFANELGFTETNQWNFVGAHSMTFVEDSGGTTARTYKTVFRNGSTTGEAYVQRGSSSRITIIEVSA